MFAAGLLERTRPSRHVEAPFLFCKLQPGFSAAVVQAVVHTDTGALCRLYPAAAKFGEGRDCRSVYRLCGEIRYAAKLRGDMQ